MTRADPAGTPADAGPPRTDLAEERAALRAVVRALLGRHRVRAGADEPRGYDPRLWDRLCKEIGVAGLAVPERYGGAGASLRETAIVLEELGRTLTPTPLLGCPVLAGQALLAAGDDAACRAVLPGVCAGYRLVALAWTGPDGRWEPDEVACTVGPDGRITGEAHHVLDGAAADTLLVAARGPDGIGLYRVDPAADGVSRAAATGLDLTRRLAVIRLDGAPGRRIGTGDPLPRVRDVACAALSAEQVGAAERALEITVAYTKTRVQFGRPIGAFQALQLRLADLHVRVAAARSASEAAVAAVADGSPEAPALAAAAKVYCSETLQAVAGEMIQMHGGVAITWDHDAHHYLRRAYAAAQLFGPPRGHVARLSAMLL